MLWWVLSSPNQLLLLVKVCKTSSWTTSFLYWLGRSNLNTPERVLILLRLPSPVTLSLPYFVSLFLLLVPHLNIQLLFSFLLAQLLLMLLSSPVQSLAERYGDVVESEPHAVIAVERSLVVQWASKKKLAYGTVTLEKVFTQRRQKLLLPQLFNSISLASDRLASMRVCMQHWQVVFCQNLIVLDYHP